MACLDMCNSDQHNVGHYPPITSPRISFSNDFADTNDNTNIIKQERNCRSQVSSSSSDFEFSVSNLSVMSGADELFYKGKLLPFKDNNNNQIMQRTLRDELLVDDDNIDVSPRFPKGSGRWKGFLGLKRTQIGSKKGFKNDDGLAQEAHHATKTSQVMMNEVEPSSQKWR